MLLHETSRASMRVAVTVFAAALLTCPGPKMAEAGGRIAAPVELSGQVLPYYKLEGVSRDEARALLASAQAAVYFPDRGTIELLAEDNLEAAMILLSSSPIPDGSQHQQSSTGLDILRKVKATGSQRIATFADRCDKLVHEDSSQHDEPYLVKMPSSKPAPEGATTTTKRLPISSDKSSSQYLYQDFEGDVWSYWDRYDNTDGRYTWSIRSCDSHSGLYSADAPRGGSYGSTLGCSDAYPESLDIYMYSEACMDTQPSWKGYLQLTMKSSIDRDGDDAIAIWAKAPDNTLWGYSFWGNWGWYPLVFNLRQWVRIGDLGSQRCNTLYFNFESDSLSGSGTGARVDDLYIWYGSVVGSYSECAIEATPTSGMSPLLVSFQASTDSYYPEVSWSFGDGTSSNEIDPTHLFYDPGTYRVRLRYDDSSSICYSSVNINVTQGSCTYSLSPPSASYDAFGGNGSVAVTTSSSSCSWDATSDVSWLTITSGTIGTGGDYVSYSVDENTGSSSRTGTLTIANRTFTVTQASEVSCAYDFSPKTINVPARASTGSTQITAPSGCAWTATSNAAWLAITSGSTGSGNGSVSIRADENTSTSSRTGAISIANMILTVIQSGATVPAANAQLVAGIAHAAGDLGSAWRSSLAITNWSGARANVTLTYHHSGGSTTRSVAINDFSIVEWVDIARTLFNLAGDTAGSVSVESDRPLIVTARTYSDTPDGTVGQFLPGIASPKALNGAQTGMLPQVKKTAVFRTNIGFINLGTAAVTVGARLFSQSGVQLGPEISRTLAPGAWSQINDAFDKAGISECPIGFALVRITNGSGPIWAYASIVDGDSSDPTTIPVYVQ